jgi:hypothetical protein
MSLNYLVCLASILFIIASTASPVKDAITSLADPSSQQPAKSFDLQEAHFNILADLHHMNIGKDSTLQDLLEKVDPLLESRYDDNGIISRVAFDYMETTLGVAQKVVERYKYRRLLQSQQKSQDKYRAKWESNRKKGDSSSTAPIQRSRWGGAPEIRDGKHTAANNARTKQRWKANELELEDLAEVLQKHRLQDETGFEAFYNLEDELRGALSKKKFTHLMGEHMKRTKGWDGWRAGYVKYKNKISSDASRKRRVARLRGLKTSISEE